MRIVCGFTHMALAHGTKLVHRKRRHMYPSAEVEMPKHQRFVLTIVVVGASFVPAATAFAGMNLGNHNETLLLDT
jgi:hypothetical protein